MTSPFFLASRAAIACAAVTLLTPAASADALPDDWAGIMDFRTVGPVNMGGRITDISVYEADPTIFYMAAASGGLLKTTNGGTTFEHQFTDQPVASMGDVEVFQGDPNIVWVGTGEENPRNSVSWGNGVYKSTDGGQTWEHKGLKDSFQIGAIAIHPENPDIVYVAALGRLWGPNEQRGLFRTQDGGDTWEHVLAIDADTGCMDIEMHPQDPYTLLVTSYVRRRDMFDTNDPAVKYGEQAGIWRTRDGGDTFERLSDGLPTVQLGRINVEYFDANPEVVYALIETELIGLEPENAPYLGVQGQDAGGVGARLTEIVEGSPAEIAGLESGDIVIKVEDTPTLSYDGLVVTMRQYAAGDTVRLEVVRGEELEQLDVTFGRRPSQTEDSEGDERERDEKAAREAARRASPFGTRLGGQRPNIQDQQGPEGFQYGGLFKSEDGGDSWERINSLNPRPMYFSLLKVDPSDDQNIFIGGISMHQSEDGGKTFDSDSHRGRNGAIHVDHHTMWINPSDGRHILVGNDGGLYETRDRMTTWDHYNNFTISQFYHATVDHRENYRIYGGLQDNGSWGGPQMVPDTTGPRLEDWYRVGGGDGFICLTDPRDPDLVYYQSQNGGYAKRNIRTGEGGSLRPRGQRGQQLRWNWRAPFALSHHNSSIYYQAGNHVFRSLMEGENPQMISPNLAHTERGAATAFAESPVDEHYLFVGTDDGALWATWDGGDTWHDLFEPIEMDESAEDGGRERRGEPMAGRRRGGAPAEAGAGRRGRGEASRGEAMRGDAPRGGRLQVAGEGRGAQLLQSIIDRDANGDGIISRDEAGDRMRRMFDRFDADESGGIDRTELRALAERMGVQWRGGDADASAPPAPVDAASERARRAAESGQSDRPAAGRGERRSDRAGGRRGRGGERAERGARGADMTPAADPISGRWTGRVIADDIEAADREVSAELTLADNGSVTGTLRSRMGDMEVEGDYDADARAIVLSADGEAVGLELKGDVAENVMELEVLASGMVMAEVRFTRSASEAAAAAGASSDAASAEAAPSAGPSSIADLVPTRMLVSEIVASRADRDRVYMTIDGHRSNIDLPFVFRSEDAGKTWVSIRSNLPDDAGSARTIAEDLVNQDILWLGTEFGLWVSLDRGDHWTRFHGRDFPTVAVHAIAQHHSSGEIILGTHGRGIWIADVTAIRQMSEETMAARAHLYEPNTVTYWKRSPGRGSTLRKFTGENPSQNAELFVSLSREANDAEIRILDAQGREMRTLDVPTGEGLHRVVWDCRREVEGRGGRRFRPRVGPGMYKVELSVDGTTMSSMLEIRNDPTEPTSMQFGLAYEEMLAELEELEEEEGEEPVRRRVH